MKKSGVYLFTILNLLFVYTSYCNAELPHGYGNAGWGITVSELKKIVKLKDANGSGSFYAEHFEWKPDVYFSEINGKKVEYYFYENRLYKIFVIHSGLTEKKTDDSRAVYSRVVKNMRADFGKEKKAFKEVQFGFLIIHTLWKDKITSIDVRMGAGYVYTVYTFNRLNKKKMEDMKEHFKREKEYKEDGIIDL